MMENESMRSGGSPLRIGAVCYLNSKPLIEALPELLPHAQLLLDYPSALARQLAEGTLDVALVPAVELFRNPDYQILSNACVASCGPVLSVQLLSHVPVDHIETLAVDAGSRTSVALTRLLLQNRYGVSPQIVPFPLDRTSLNANFADAFLLIGDRAMRPIPGDFAARWDLGEEWTRWTGLPFVFAAWIGRGESDIDQWGSILSTARDRGLERLDAIVQRECRALQLPVPLASAYLREHLHFHFGEQERLGFLRFGELLAESGLIEDANSAIADSPVRAA